MEATAHTQNHPLRQAPKLFQWSIFPVVMAAVIASSYFLLVRGVNPALAILGPQFAAFFIVAVAERIFPYHNSWLQSQHDIGVDAAHTVGIGVTTGLLAPILVSTGVAVAAWLSATLGSELWPNEWPLLAQPGYWVHRGQHSFDSLWRFHSVHHSAPRLYWLNAGRFHPVDIMLTYVPSYFLLVMLGCNEVVLAYFGLVSSVHGIFQHANLQMKLGPLNWIFSMAELHRWHHSRTIEEANTNFGQTISIWDWVFGTRFLPEDREPPRDIGIADLPNFPMTWWAQILAPFRWRKVKEESSGS
jgi:sterol desaturase/sphingolipid hydroxylase (fatty acid hydroxylase superfamily)